MPARANQWDNHPLREIVTDTGDRVADDVADAIRTLPVLNEFNIHPFATGNLTATGDQYSASVDTTTIHVNANVEAVNIALLENATIKWMEFNLTAGINAVSNADVVMYYTWQARNNGGTWVSLHTPTANTPGTTEIEKTVAGYFAPSASFNQIPCELKLIVNCNMANEGRARTKNSSYFKVLYVPR